MSSRSPVQRHLDVMAETVSRLDDAVIQRIVDVLHDAYRNGRVVVAIGNGGSASTAAHFAADLGKFATFPNAGFRAVDLVSNVAALTAWVNDEGWEHAYDHALRAWVGPGDVVVAFSVHGGTGWSGNVTRALEVANEIGCTTIGVAANDGGAFADLCDHVVVVPEPPAELVTPVTEAVHVVVHHVICTALRDAIAR